MSQTKRVGFAGAFSQALFCGDSFRHSSRSSWHGARAGRLRRVSWMFSPQSARVGAGRDDCKSCMMIGWQALLSYWPLSIRQTRTVPNDQRRLIKNANRKNTKRLGGKPAQKLSKYTWHDHHAPSLQDQPAKLLLSSSNRLSNSGTRRTRAISASRCRAACCRMAFNSVEVRAFIGTALERTWFRMEKGE